MNRRRPIFITLLCAALASASSLAFWGCKGNSAAVVSAVAVAPPPVLHVLPTAGNPLLANPATDPLWARANWSSLTPPLHDSRTTPPTRVASLYTPTDLYVAFLCADQYVPPRNDSSTPPSSAAIASNSSVSPPATLQGNRVEVWLDTSAAQNGTDVFAIQVAPDGATSRTWYRSSIPPEPKDDGSPNPYIPLNQLPNYDLPGLAVHTARATLDGQPAWSVVVAIPLDALPRPLRIPAKDIKEGAHWRINLIRTSLVNNTDAETVQSNLSPVYPSCQQISPYRMAELLLDGPLPGNTAGGADAAAGGAQGAVAGTGN